MGREVITVQAGTFANYVGAHYWNIQVNLHDDIALCCMTGLQGSMRLHGLAKSSCFPQDELLGLAADPEKGYLADQIDPTVLLRQREDRQVRDCMAL